MRYALVILFVLMSSWSAGATGAQTIHSAAEVGDLAAVKKLIERDPGLIHARDKVDNTWPPKSRTPLHLAVENGHLEVVKYLISHNANVNARDAAGRTPIFLADTKEMAELLIKCGAQLNIDDRLGDTPLLHAATFYRSGEVVTLLRSKGARIRTIHEAAYFGDLKLARKLLRSKPKLHESRDSLYDTPLHCAAIKGHVEIMKLLLASGADIDAEGCDGFTPLLCAADEGRLEAARLLLERGADVNKWASSGGDTPLHRAAQHADVKMVTLLIKHGADVNSTMGHTWGTPLDSAARFPKVAEIIRKHGGKKEELAK